MCSPWMWTHRAANIHRLAIKSLPHFRGILREVRLRVVPGTFIENIFSKPKDALTEHPPWMWNASLASRGIARTPALEVNSAMAAGDRQSTQKVPPSEASGGPTAHVVHLDSLGAIKLWDLGIRISIPPCPPSARTQLWIRTTHGWIASTIHRRRLRTNGRVMKPARPSTVTQTFRSSDRRAGAPQRSDARILRTSQVQHSCHLALSRIPAFPDACDEKWDYLCSKRFPAGSISATELGKQISIDNLGRMIRRDWNHPSIILWGVRITNRGTITISTSAPTPWPTALDPTRPTGGIRYFYIIRISPDVFTMNDFGSP